MRKEILAVLLVLLATIGMVAATLFYEDFQKEHVFTVDLLARAPENGNWYPHEIVLPKGKKARIRIRNIETVTHGFAAPALDIAVGEIRAGEVRIVEFTPTQEGRYDFMCTVWCSRHHLSMTGRIIVK